MAAEYQVHMRWIGSAAHALQGMCQVESPLPAGEERVWVRDSNHKLKEKKYAKWTC